MVSKASMQITLMAASLLIWKDEVGSISRYKVHR